MNGGISENMISEEAAREKILAATEPLECESLPLAAARGRFASCDIFAKLPLPLFDNSAMDGYAARAEDCAAGAQLRVSGEQAAGLDRKLTVEPGCAVRIFTGAPIPRGADAVIMQEDVRAENGSITVLNGVQLNENIRKCGGDLCAGEKIVSQHDIITPQSASLLASQGFANVSVHRAPRVAILSTGDELAAPGDALSPGQIYESNGVMLEMLAQNAGAQFVARLGSVSDEADALREKLRAGLDQNDALIISGGVSVGEHDLVKSELRNLGAQLDIWRVAVRPGKPFLFGQFGSGRGRCAIFGLPGNPGSSFVTFLLFVRPALLKMLGARDLFLPRANAILASDLRNDSDRPHYFRGKFSDGKFTPFGRQESHALFGLSQSNALFRSAPGESAAAGSPAEILRI